MSHPSWCDRACCVARGSAGAHRSRPVVIDRLLLVRANLYSPAAAPGVAFVELRCGTAVLRAREAYGLGRALMSLGRAAEDAPF